MKEVQSVKEMGKVNLIGELLERHYKQQFADVWNLGLQLALRITDLLDLKFSDIKEGRVVITEGKTGKLASIILNVKALQIIERIRSDNPDHQYLFQSTGRNVKTVKPITRQAVGQAFKAIGEIVGVHLSTHSMRKTRGYHLYQASNDITKVMKMLRHSSQAETLRYIGITQENIDQDFMELVL
ncbi:MAG: integrase [Oleiphilaceae bacterium]|jgi:integrase